MLYAFSVYVNILIMRRYAANNLLKKNSARSSWDICPEVVCRKFFCFRRLWHIACTAMWELLFFLSLRSKRLRASSSRTLGREQKKKGMTGEGEGREGKACPQTPFPHPSPLPLPILLPIPSFFAPVPTFALYLDWKRLLRRLIFSWFS